MASTDISEDTRQLVRQLEGFRSSAYVDAKGHSIGYGHYIKPGEEHLLTKKISKEEAEQYLEEDIRSHQKPWIGKLKEGTPSSAVTALTSFAYNVGPYSPGLKKAVAAINAGDIDGATKIMAQFNVAYDPKVGAKVVNQSLVARREFEGRILRGEKVDLKKFGASPKSRTTSVMDSIKNLFGKPPPPNLSTSSIMDGAAASNAMVLQELKRMNADLKTNSKERAYLERLKLEGSGLWAAQ